MMMLLLQLLLLCTPQSIHAEQLLLHGLEEHAYGARPEPAFSFSVSSAPTTGSRRRLQAEQAELGSELASLTYAGADAHGGTISFSSTSAVRPEVVSLDEAAAFDALLVDVGAGGGTEITHFVASAGMWEDLGVAGGESLVIDDDVIVLRTTQGELVGEVNSHFLSVFECEGESCHVTALRAGVVP